MANNLGILARLFGRAQRPAPIVSALFANAIGQPLLVHPQMGEQLIGGYLHGAVDARPPLVAVGELAPEYKDAATGVVTQGRSVAVLNVSGALVNRFEGGMCDPGPLSYEELTAAYNSALADSQFEAIVLRLETPGGMASGLFDLADRINATNAKSGGAKRVIACIDDYAYSAGYGLAAACDEVWITRTGGAGSVGVIAYHYDQSGYDAKIGLKVTPVFSGEHKADMSPHAPLGDSARDWLQGRMDSMRTMFAQSVADYRGMDFAAVIATEAQVYQGHEAIAIGFADRVGTFADLMRELAYGPGDDAQLPPVDPRVTAALAARNAAIGSSLAMVIEAGVTADQAVAGLQAMTDAITTAGTVSAEDRAKMDRAEVADAITASTLAPAPAMALLTSTGVTPENVGARIAYAMAVTTLCHAAGIGSVASDYITKNVDLETVRAQLIAAKAEDGPEINTTIPGAKSGTAGSGIWGETIKKFGG